MNCILHVRNDLFIFTLLFLLCFVRGGVCEPLSKSEQSVNTSLIATYQESKENDNSKQFQVSSKSALSNRVPQGKTVYEHFYPGYPYDLAPPFGTDHGPSNPKMIYAGNAYILATDGALGPAIPSDLQIKQPLGTIPAYYIVHFIDTIRSEWRRAVENEGVIWTGNYLKNNAMICYLEPPMFKALKKMTWIDWIGYYEPAYKLSPQIGTVPRHAEPGLKAWDGFFTLVLMKGVEPDAVANEINSTTMLLMDDIEAIKRNKYAPKPWQSWKLTVLGSYAELIALASYDDIQYILETPTVKQYHVGSGAGIVQSGSNAAWSDLGTDDPPITSSSFYPLWLDHNLRGQHQMVGLSDSGVDYTNGLLVAPVSPLDTSPTYSLKVPKAALLPLQTFCDYNGHGTLVAGAIGQDLTASDTTEFTENPRAGRGEFRDGIAHEAQIVIAPNEEYDALKYEIFRLQLLELVTFGASVINRSWSWCSTGDAGCNPISPTNIYDIQSSFLDDIMNSDEYVLLTNSFGNEGSCSTATWPTEAGSITSNSAKGPLDVGGSDDLGLYNYTMAWSTKGPNCDGIPGSTSADMIAPHVVAPADDSAQTLSTGLVSILSTGCNPNPNNYIEMFSGTSMAAGIVAGAAALVHQYFEEGYYPSISDPTGTLMKAMIINSAEKINDCFGTGTSSKRPGGDQGWGLVNLSDVLAFDETSFKLNAWDVPNAIGFDTQGEFDQYFVSINNTSIPLRFTLVWLDEEATPGTSQGPWLVNDLDLVITKGAINHYGNNFDQSTGWSNSNTAVDRANEVENIFLSPSQVAILGTGLVTVNVTAAVMNGLRNQGYALVVTGGIEPETTVSLDRVEYQCSGQTATITITDISFTPDVCTLTSPTDSVLVSLSSAGGDIYTGTVPLSESDSDSGNNILGVTHGDTIVLNYDGYLSETATINCQLPLSDSGFILEGGCDNEDIVESDNQYMDGGEYTSYTFGFTYVGPRDLTDVRAELSFTGAGSAYMSVLSPQPVVVGNVTSDQLIRPVFQVFTDPSIVSAKALLDCDFVLTVTSPADGYSVEATLSHTHRLNADDIITPKSICWDHVDSETGWLQDNYVASWKDNYSTVRTVGAPWTHSTDSINCGDEDGTWPCGVSNDASWVSQSVTYTSGNCQKNLFTQSSTECTDDILYSPIFGPDNSGSSPSGEPWMYAFKQHSFFYKSDMVTPAGQPAAMFCTYYDDDNPGGVPPQNAIDDYPLHWGDYYFDNQDWDNSNAGDPTDPDPANWPSNFMAIDLSSVQGVIGSSPPMWRFALELYDVDWGGNPYLTPKTEGIWIDNQEFQWDEYYTVVQETACPSQVGLVAWDFYDYTSCPVTAVVSVIDDSNTASSVTISSLATGDSITVSLSGTGPYYSGTAILSTFGGSDDPNILFIGTNDTVTATYTDSSPVGTSESTAIIDLPASFIRISAVNFNSAKSSGDDDSFADTNETYSFSLSLINLQSSQIDNVVATIHSASTNVLCLVNDTASFGNIPPMSKANNTGTEFSFQVPPDYVCSDPANPDQILFFVSISADGSCGTRDTLSTYFTLDLEQTVAKSMEIPQTKPLPRLLKERMKSGNILHPALPDKSDPYKIHRAPPNRAKSFLKSDSTRNTTCGNIWYDDGQGDNIASFGGGKATDSNYMMGVLFNPLDFNIYGAYTISQVCFGNDIVAPYGLETNVWFIYPDNNGVPDDSVYLAADYMSTGDGTGEDIHDVTITTQNCDSYLGPGQRFWVMVRGNTAVSNGTNFNVEFDSTTPRRYQSYFSETGVAGLELYQAGDFVIHATIAHRGSFSCDTTDNSTLPDNCTSNVPYPPLASSVTVQKDIAKAPGDITVLWDSTTCPSADYNIIYGSLADVSTLTLSGSKCDISASGTYHWTNPPAGNIFFIVTGINATGGAIESSWGTDSDGVERNGTNDSGECSVINKDLNQTCP